MTVVGTSEKGKQLGVRTRHSRVIRQARAPGNGVLRRRAQDLQSFGLKGDCEWKTYRATSLGMERGPSGIERTHNHIYSCHDEAATHAVGHTYSAHGWSDRCESVKKRTSPVKRPCHCSSAFASFLASSELPKERGWICSSGGGMSSRARGRHGKRGDGSGSWSGERRWGMGGCHVAIKPRYSHDVTC